MREGGLGGSAAALRVLRSAADEIDTLDRGTLSPDGERRHILRVANAVDRSLRRLLRDDEAAELELRLKALAPDEIGADAVLAELRRNDRLPLETAAAVHELFEIRRALEGDHLAARGDADRAVRAARSLEAVLSTPPQPSGPQLLAGSEDSAATGTHPPEDTPVSRGTSRRTFRRRSELLAGGAAATVLLVAAILLLRPSGPDHMEQGIALFRTGAYADAAHHFWRHAEENGDDPTPHLYLARIHRRMDRPELAAEALREAQRLAPEDPAVHRELGFLLLDTGEPAVAVDRFRAALELDRNSSEAWVGLVRALRESGRPEEAESTLGQAPPEVRALISNPPAS